MRRKQRICSDIGSCNDGPLQVVNEFKYRFIIQSVVQKYKQNTKFGHTDMKQLTKQKLIRSIHDKRQKLHKG